MTRNPVEPEALARWTEHFRIMGATEPESWARSQLAEQFPQYARFVFLKQAWTSVVPEDNTSWIESLIKSSKRQPRSPGAGAGPALERMLAAGVTPQDITDVVRVMQWDVLAALAYQLSDPSVVEYPSDELPRVEWALFEVDDNGEPLQLIPALHESVLDTEPSGREMRPRGVGREG